MPLFIVKWDGMGFTSRRALTEREFTETQAARYTKALRLAGELPPNIHGVLSADISPDGKDDGEWKVFVAVEVIVEAESMKAAESLEAPEELLLKVASKMIRGDAEAELDLRGSFMVLDCYDYTEPPVALKKARNPRPVKTAVQKQPLLVA
jgi:hypothetical protein